MNSETSRPFAAQWRDAVLSTDGPPKLMTRLVLLALAKYMNGAGENCWPSVEIIVTDTGLARRSVLRHLAEAKASGWVRVRSRGANGQGWRRHAYSPTLPRGVTAAPRPDEGGAGEAPRLSGGGANECTKVVPESPKRGATVAPEQEREQEREQGRAHARPLGLPGSVSDELWSDFMDHRKEIRKPMTSKAVSMLVTKLTRMESEGHNAGDALQESIINGWQGVFPPKAGDRAASPSARPSQRRVSPSDHEISSYD